MPEIIFEEAYEEAPQWAIIEGLAPGMFSKEAVNIIASTLGKPLYEECLDTYHFKHALRVCFVTKTSFKYRPCINDGNKSSRTSLKVTYRSCSQRYSHCELFGHRTKSCGLMTKKEVHEETHPTHVDSERSSNSIHNSQAILVLNRSSEENTPPIVAERSLLIESIQVGQPVMVPN